MYFLPKTFIKHCRNRDKPIYRLKKLKKYPKSQNQLELRSVFSQTLKIKIKKHLT